MRRVLVTGMGPVSRAAARSLRERGAEVVTWSRRGADLAGDLRDDAPFHGVDLARLTDIVHAAADTRFTIDRATAQDVNVGGTRKALELARRCPRLESFTLVSSLHAAGLATGLVEEDALARPPAFANEYERSKHDAEALVQEVADVPWRVVRLATLADASQPNALTATLRLMRAGLLPLVPGLAACPVHVVGPRLAGEAIAVLLDAPAFTHWNVTSPVAPALADVLARAHARLARDARWRWRRVPMPLLTDRATFDLLADGGDGLVSPLVTRSLRCLRPFAAQLFAPKTVATARTRELVPALAGHDAGAALDALADALAPKEVAA